MRILEHSGGFLVIEAISSMGLGICEKSKSWQVVIHLKGGERITKIVSSGEVAKSKLNSLAHLVVGIDDYLGQNIIKWEDL